jgi:hypothetical protein
MGQHFFLQIFYSHFKNYLIMKNFYLLLFTLLITSASFGQQGQVLDFDGINDDINCGSSINLANTSFTIEFWAKRAVQNSDDFILLNQESQTTNKSLHIGFRANNNFTFAFWNNDLDILGLSDLNWHHWACTYDATNQIRKVYRDGVEVGSETSIPNFTGTPVTVKIGSRDGNSYFDGQLDEVRIWNDVRTIAEILNNMCIDLSGSEANLVAYYPFDNVTTANGTANEIQDESTNSYNGTSSGMDNSDIVNLNLAGNFDGTDDYVDCGNSINLANESFTIEFWAKRDVENIISHMFSSGTPYINNKLLHIGFQGNDIQFSFWGYELKIGGLSDLYWHHWSFTYSADINEAVIYRDGIPVGSDNSVPNDFSGTGPTRIGQLGNNTNYFDGQIDEVRIWNFALSASDITNLYDDTFSDPTTISSCLMAYYKLNESCGTSTLDATGNGHNGTLQNGVVKTSSGAGVSLQASPICTALCPIITISAPTVTQPCATPTGTIVVNATTTSGTLEYSIDNGSTYHASNTFSGLSSLSKIIIG